MIGPEILALAQKWRNAEEQEHNTLREFIGVRKAVEELRKRRREITAEIDRARIKIESLFEASKQCEQRTYEAAERWAKCNAARIAEESRNGKR